MSLKLKLRNIPQCYSCPQCQQIFKNALHLKYHKFRVHNSRRPYICRSCRRTFHSVCELQDHSRVHNDSPTMQCHVCDESFSTRKLLKQHMTVHVHYEGDHECGYCTATFLSLADARLHVLLVHDDMSVLPPCRVRKKFNSAASDVFTVKEGDGLKLKLKRKLSLEGDEYNTDMAGSHTSDSGRGNSDIDDDDYNKLLRTPTFIPKHETQQQQFNQTESNLLLKPKLEIGAPTSWTSNKYQPRLNSSDFLQKTSFLSNTQTTFGQQSSLGSIAPKTSQAPLFGQPSLSKSFTSPSFGMSGNPLNGGVFKTPNLFNSMKKPSVFGSTFSSNTFGSTPFTKPAINSTFGSSTSFGIKPPNGFLQPQPIKQTAVNVPSNVSSPASTDSGPEVKKEAIFGSKEHARSMMLTDEEKPNAFEKYAGDEQADLNPFAEAMKRAKNPPPRLDSELSESSYESESTSESEDAVIDTEELHDADVPIPMTPQIDEIPAEPVVPKPPEPAIFDLPPPTPYLSPVRETVSEHIEPEPSIPEPLPPSPAPPSPEPIRQSPRKTRRGKSPKQPSPITSSPLVNGNLYESPKYGDLESEKTNGIPSPPPPRTTRKTRSTSSSSKPTTEPKSKPTEFTEPPTPLMNGDVGHAPTEISGHIDLEVPSFMITVPRSLISEPSSKPRSRNNSGVKPRSARTPGGRTPARTPARTPSRTPSRTPLYNTNFDLVPPTPIMPDIPEKPMRTPTRISSRKIAPSKDDMMKKHEQQAKKATKPKSPQKRIGPKSFMKKINRYEEESEEELEEMTPEVEPTDLEDGSFAPDEVYQETSAGRTDVHAPHISSFKQNTKFLLYLRQRALDMLIVLFPHLRVGGHFTPETDVDGLMDYLISTLNGDDGMRRVMHSHSTKREQCKIVCSRSTKYEIKQLRARIIKLLKLCFPLLTLDTVTKQGIDAIPKLIQKIITENS